MPDTGPINSVPPLSQLPSDSLVRSVVAYRNQRVRDQLVRLNCSGILLYDPVNIRYATNSSNMQVWCLHNNVRYALILRDGPTVLFEFPGAAHNLEQQIVEVDEIRSPIIYQYMMSGSRYKTHLKDWANDLDEVLRKYIGGEKRLAFDRLDHGAAMLLLERGYELHDGHEVMEQARSIKSENEMVLVRQSMAVCEAAVRALQDSIRPGITEQALWSVLHQKAIELGGEWFETRLLTSGPRTNPWYQECSDREIEKGDMIALDTDFVGPYGYCSDVSRSWVCGAAPTETQHRLYADAQETLERNISHLKAGVSLRDFSVRCGTLPARYQARRYTVLVHGIGLTDEYPFVPFKDDIDKYGVEDACFEENMTVCVEALVAEEHGKEAVKLEEQVRITVEGVERLSRYPLDQRSG